MSNKGSSVTGILGGAGGGSGGITIGTTVSGGTPSTLLWVDSGGLVQSGASVLASASDLTINRQLLFVAGGSLKYNFNFSNQFELSANILSNNNFQGGPSALFTWGAAVQTPDVNLNRVTAGVITVGTTAANGLGWLQNGGECALNANYTNATATFSNTNLSITVISGRTYNFEVNLFITESTAADGWQLDFNGGTAAMTNFIANAVSFSETGAIVALANAVSAALATVINATTTGTTGGQWIKVQGSFVPSGNGTFIVRAAQNTHSTGTLTIKRGSNLITRDSKAV